MTRTLPSLEEVLLRASRVDPALEPLARRAASLLGKTELPPQTGPLEEFAAALAQALPARKAQLLPDELAAARACLRGLSLLVRVGTDERDAMREQASADAGLEAATRERYGEDGRRCPRCGSRRVHEERSHRDRTRMLELLCGGCGAFAVGEALPEWGP